MAVVLVLGKDSKRITRNNGVSPAYGERQGKDHTINRASPAIVGIKRKRTKHNSGDSPALKEREENAKKHSGDWRAFRARETTAKINLAIFLSEGKERHDK